MKRRCSGLILITGLLLTGCTAPQNSAPCTEYSAAFNAVADAVDGEQAGTVTSAQVRVELDARTGRIEDARENATGTVSAEIGTSAELSFAAESGDEDAGIAFYYQSKDVEAACLADGSPIDLH